MDLEDFIKTTLVGLYKGITSANAELGGGKFSVQAGDKTDVIDFDVALSVGAQNVKSGDGKLRVFIAQVGASVDATNSTQTVSRVKFKIKPASWIQ